MQKNEYKEKLNARELKKPAINIDITIPKC
jgi:hypothetical protein